MPRRSTIGTALLGALVTLSVGACGSDAGDEFEEQSARKIMEQAEKDTKSLKSVRLVGSIPRGDGTLEIDLSADEDGNCSGILTVAGGTADVLSIGGASYIRGDEAFWRASTGASADQVLAVLGDKWAKLPAGDDSFSEFCDIDNVFAGDDAAEKYTKGEVGTVAGQEAVEILVEEEGEGTRHAWVSTDSKHYVLKVEQVGGDEPGTFQLGDFNEPVDAVEPAEGEYVDLGSLG
jgi:hypothetical protein